MQSVVGALRVNLGLDSAQFSRGMSQAQKDIANARKAFVAVAAVGVATFAAVTAAALRGAGGIDESAKAARRLDSSIGSFRAMKLVAGEAGVAVSTLADSGQTMDREIAKGSKAALDSLTKLNLTAKDLEGLEVDQKMALIADSIQDLGLSTGDTSAVLQGLGIRNREMVLALGAGGDAFRAGRRDIEDYGLAISSVDAAAIEKANDQIGRLGLISQYAGEQLAIALVPAMGAMAQAMTDSLREGGLLRTVIDGLAGNLDVLAVAGTAVTAVMGARYVLAMTSATGVTGLFTGALVAARAALATLLGPLGLVYIAIGAGAAAWIAHRAATNDSATAMTSAESAAKDLSIELTQMAGTDLPNASRATVQLANDNLALARSAYAAAQAQNELAIAALGAADQQLGNEGMSGIEFDLLPGQAAQKAAREALIASQVALAAAEEDLNNRIFEGTQIKTEAAEVIERLAGTVSDLEDEVAGGGGSGGGAAGAVESLNLGIDETADVAMTASSEMQAFESNLQSAFTSFVTGAKSAREAAAGLLSSLADMAANAAFKSLIGGALGGGGAFGSFVGAVFGSTAPSFSGGGFTGMGARSGGLDGQGGFMAMLHPNETVIDHTRGGGSQPVNVTFAIDARGSVDGVADQIDQRLRQQLPELSRTIVAAVADAQGRGRNV